jgi:type III secretory pathway component EscV
LAALIKVIVKKDFKHISIASKLVVAWFIFPFFTMFIVSFWIPMFIGRYLIFLSLGYYLLLALSSIYLVKSKRYQFVIPGILLILFVFTVKLNIGNKRHVKEIIAKIEELKDSNTVVLVCPQFFDLIIEES